MFEESCFTKWYERYGEYTFRVAKSVCWSFGIGSTLVARDLSQDAWVKLWRSRDRGRPVKYPKSYIGRCAVNTVLDAFECKERRAFFDGTFDFKPEIIEPVSGWADSIGDLIDAKDYLENQKTRSRKK